MTEIPTWWLVVSAAFFVVNLLMFAALGYAVIKLVAFMKEVQPQITGLSTKVHSLIDTVEGVAKRVEEVALSVKDTVDGVGGKAKGVVGSAEIVMHSASKQFEKFSPFLVGTLTAIRLIKGLNEMRHGRPATKATSRKSIEKKPAKPLKRKKGLFGLF